MELNIKIDSDQRDELLDLCNTSKEVDEHYDKASEAIDLVNQLPTYLSSEFDFPTLDKLWENSEEKLWFIDQFIRELVTEDTEPDWYNEIIKEMDSLFAISDDTAHDSIAIKDLIIDLKVQAWRDFLNK